MAFVPLAISEAIWRCQLDGCNGIELEQIGARLLPLWQDVFFSPLGAIENMSGGSFAKPTAPLGTSSFRTMEARRCWMLCPFVCRACFLMNDWCLLQGPVKIGHSFSTVAPWAAGSKRPPPSSEYKEVER